MWLIELLSGCRLLLRISSSSFSKGSRRSSSRLLCFCPTGFPLMPPHGLPLPSLGCLPPHASYLIPLRRLALWSDRVLLGAVPLLPLVLRLGFPRVGVVPVLRSGWALLPPSSGWL